MTRPRTSNGACPRHRCWRTLLVVAFLAACLPSHPPPPAEGMLATPVTLGHEVGFEPGTAILAAPEQARLEAFLEIPANAAVTRIEVFTGSDPLGLDRRDAVSAVARRALADAPLSFAPSQAPNAPVRVALSYVVATPAACVRGPGGPGVLPLGCANALNLARMVRAPEDLERGRAPGDPRARPVARAAERYYAGETPSLPAQQTGTDATVADP